MDAHETTVRLADLRQRFDHARKGKPLSALGPAHANLMAADGSAPEDDTTAQPRLGPTSDPGESPHDDAGADRDVS